ncbi:hypothetical protein CR513_15872, partial [Mucuna pruriens]
MAQFCMGLIGKSKMVRKGRRKGVEGTRVLRRGMRSPKAEKRKHHFQSLVPPTSLEITLGSYKDDILCYAVPMEAAHILLGRPWKYDRKVTHHGVPNRFTFVHLGEKVVLTPLTPIEVSEDLVKMRKTREEENKEKANTEKANRKERENICKKRKRDFPKEMPQGFPSLRGIDNHIDLIVGATLPNRHAYRANLEETKEI